MPPAATSARPSVLGPGHAHAAQLGQDRRQRALDGHLELEQIGDRAAVALDVDEPRERQAVGIDERAALRAVQIFDDGHAHILAAGRARRLPDA